MQSDWSTFYSVKQLFSVSGGRTFHNKKDRTISLAQVCAFVSVSSGFVCYKQVDLFTFIIVVCVKWGDGRLENGSCSAEGLYFVEGF